MWYCDNFACLFFLMILRPPRSTQSRSSAASDVYKRQSPSSERKTTIAGGIKWAKSIEKSISRLRGVRPSPKNSQLCLLYLLRNKVFFRTPIAIRRGRASPKSISRLRGVRLSIYNNQNFLIVFISIAGDCVAHP